MRHFILIVAIVFGLISTESSAQQTYKNKVAVYVTGDVEDGYKKVIGAKLVSGIIQQPEYAAVERTVDFLNELGKEQDYQMSGAVNDNQIVKLGQQFGVRYVLVADVSSVLGSLFVAARLIDVQTGLIMAAVEADKEVDNMTGLSDLAKETITNLFRGFQREAAAKELQKYDLKITGPYTSARKLNNYFSDCPGNGYKVADESQIKKIIKHKKTLGDNLKIPVYFNIKYSHVIEQDNIDDSNSTGSRIDKHLIDYSTYTGNNADIKQETSYYYIVLYYRNKTFIMSDNYYPPKNPDSGYIYWIKDISAD